MSRTDLWHHLPLTDLSYQILLTLAGTPMHGYALLQAISDRTDGRLRPDTGTLYTALRRLHRDGMLSASESTADTRRTRNYDLTERGRELLELESRRLEKLVAEAHARNVLSGAEGPA